MKKVLSLLLAIPLVSPAQKKEPWISKPASQWPQIALINEVQFKNGDRYIHPSFEYAGTGFLIDNGKDTLAATAKHALWVARNKKTKTVQVNDQLQQWTLRPKNNHRDSAIVDQLINEDSTEILEGKGSTVTERDWIIFSVKQASPALYPLKPRYTPVKPGEKIYILSNAYKDSVATIHTGKVFSKAGLDILIERDLPDHLPGCSGSPVIDANGYLIGIISSSGTDGKTGKAVTVATSTEYLQAVLRKKDNLNTPKKDYGELILQTVLKQGAKAAIQQYKQLTSDPANYYRYNLRSADRNGLRETGEKLITMGRLQEAIEILTFNTTENIAFYGNYNLLAKAYLLAGDKTNAIRYYQLSTSKNNDKQYNEAFKELEQLQGSQQ